VYSPTTELINRLDNHWRTLLEQGHDLVLTAGVVGTNPDEHAVSRIPGYVEFALEYRSQDLDTLEAFGELLHEEIAQITAKRSIRFEIDKPSFTKPATMDEHLTNRARHYCEQRGYKHEIMPSGAGHDSAGIR
jgi:Acetylornithine deacetylase/Succinyl-diaminopimelate desuccinylase and related deacylases